MSAYVNEAIVEALLFDPVATVQILDSWLNSAALANASVLGNETVRSMLQTGQAEHDLILESLQRADLRPNQDGRKRLTNVPYAALTKRLNEFIASENIQFPDRSGFSWAERLAGADPETTGQLADLIAQNPLDIRAGLRSESALMHEGVVRMIRAIPNLDEQLNATREGQQLQNYFAGLDLGNGLE